VRRRLVKLVFKLGLPAVAAAISAAASAAISTASAAIASAASAATATEASTASTATAAEASASAIVTFFHRTRHVHGDLTTANIGSVQLRNSGLRFCVIGHFNKSEPAGATCLSVVHQAGAGHLSKLGEHFVQLFFCGAKRQTSYKQLRHNCPLWA
jgi:tRNA A-37 threonylcarbamoyl transferase component Bud32